MCRRYTKIRMAAIISLVTGACSLQTPPVNVESTVKAAVQAAVVGFHNEIEQRAARDAVNNDTFTFRLMAGGLVLLGLTYPTGKLVWLLTHKSLRTVGLIGGDGD